ncbi:MAG: hypothetical protein V3V16_14690 [Melioribacteraceae bacterium]
MFRILSIVSIAASLIWLFSFWSKNSFSFSGKTNNYFSSLKKSFFEFKLLKSQNISSNFNWAKKFFYLATTFLFLLMFLSAFLNVIFLGDDLTGLFLLIHVTVAPLFSVFLAILVILFAHSNRFSENDFNNLTENKRIRHNRSGYIKITFWLITLFSIPAMTSIILSMFPLFGTNGQHILLDIHRYSTLIIFVLVILHTGLSSIRSNSNK